MSTYSPPEASECTNSSSKVYDHLHFLYGDLEFEMALLRGLLSKFPVETDEKLHPSSGMINADGNFVFTDKSFGFQKALYETAKTACQRHNTTNKYTESQDHAFKCMSEGVEQFDVLHFLVRHGTVECIPKISLLECKIL